MRGCTPTTPTTTTSYYYSETTVLPLLVGFVLLESKIEFVVVLRIRAAAASACWLTRATPATREDIADDSVRVIDYKREVKNKEHLGWRCNARRACQASCCQHVTQLYPIENHENSITAGL